MRYLFFDVDGTLVNSPKEWDISDSNKQALMQAKKAGHKVFLCSGRGLAGCKYLLNSNLFDGIIFSDGGGVMVEGHPVKLNSVDTSVLHTTLDYIINTLHGYVMLSTMDKIYMPLDTIEEGADWVVQKDGRYYMYDVPLYDIREYHKEPVLEFDVMFTSEEDEKTFMEHLDSSMQYISTSASYGRDGGTSGEVTKAGITKGSGVQAVLDMYNDSKGMTYGFGDSMNDASLLQSTHVGIAMGNACDELKQYADYITDDIENDGIYKALRKYGLLE